MKRPVFITAHNIVSPLGETTAENLNNLLAGRTGVHEYEDPDLSPEPFFASLIEHLQVEPGLTRFETLLERSAKAAMNGLPQDITGLRGLLIVSTTKGNISLLETEPPGAQRDQRINIFHSAELVARRLGFVNRPLVVSNACISGVLAMVLGMRLIREGEYDHVVVAGADVISHFVLSGFQAFLAISPGICKPFDRDRDGINLGEAAATVVLSIERSEIEISGGAVSNDANHLSAPSRTGEELADCIRLSLEEAGLETIDMISAHGTATVYNDEMEAKAVSLAGLSDVPLNSLKAFFGHTLGAAGIVESVISIESMKQGIMLPTKGFTEAGLPVAVNVNSELNAGSFNSCLKTASGFGGCNGAVIFKRNAG